MPRGRPPLIDSKLIIEAVLKHKNRIVREDDINFISPETDSVWTEISEDLCNKIKKSSLYSYVMNNKFELRDLLCGSVNNGANTTFTDNTISSSSSNDSDESLKNENSSFIFTLSFGVTEFKKLIVETVRQCRDKKGNSKTRIVNILEPQKWTEVFAKAIYDDFKLSHGYHFKNNYINKDKESGGFSGKTIDNLIFN